MCLGLRGEIHASRASDKIVWSLEPSSLKARAEFRRVIPLEIHALGDDALEPQTAGVPEDCRAISGDRISACFSPAGASPIPFCVLAEAQGARPSR